MTTTSTWWLVFVCSVALSICGDVAMKQAWRGPSVSALWTCIGLVSYAVTSFSWLFLLKGRSLSLVGTAYPIANTIGLLAAGYVLFSERISAKNIVGILMGLGAIYLLGEAK